MFKEKLWIVKVANHIFVRKICINFEIIFRHVRKRTSRGYVRVGYVDTYFDVLIERHQNSILFSWPISGTKKVPYFIDDNH